MIGVVWGKGKGKGRGGEGENVTRKKYQGHIKKNWVGGPRSQGYTNVRNCYGGSIGGLEAYLTVNRS